MYSTGCDVKDYGDVLYETKHRDGKFKEVFNMKDVIEFNKEVSGP